MLPPKSCRCGSCDGLLLLLPLLRVVVAVSSRAAASLRATEGDRFCGSVFDLARSVINVVVVFVVGVPAPAPAPAAAAVAVDDDDDDDDVVAVASPRSTLGNGTASMLVRERDFISFIGVEVFVCMRLISESSSSSATATHVAVDVCRECAGDRESACCLGGVAITISLSSLKCVRGAHLEPATTLLPTPASLPADSRSAVAGIESLLSSAPLALLLPPPALLPFKLITFSTMP